MLRFSANISTMFAEVDFIERFEKAAAAGFKAVELQFPYDWEARQLAEKLSQYELKLVLHNLPPGRFALGRGRIFSPDPLSAFQARCSIFITKGKGLSVLLPSMGNR